MPPPLDRDRWRQLETLLDEALDLSPGERQAFVDRVEDPTLREDLAALLAADAVDSALLDRPLQEFLTVSVTGPTAGAPLTSGEQIGPYRIEREIGRGGMGRVFLARRTGAGFDQQVALKVVRAGLDDEELVARFLQERQILARLEHPNIARLIDGGVTADGRPFFAMEYVEGEPITTYCDARQLDVDQRLALFVSVCEAVRYAHQQLIVHRDLKPSNTLVTAGGGVKLLDFGIAKLLEDDRSEVMVTRTGWRPLTPEYAAPEQLLGERVTTATDVYALGVLLFELLTGRRPFRVPVRTPASVERAVLTSEPDRPSSVLAHPGAALDAAAGGLTTLEEIARARRTRPERLRRQLRGDLDTIVLRAMQKDPARRYPSVEALVEDLDRHRRGLPVRARPDTALYAIGKFVARHRVGVAASLLVVLSLVGGLVTAAWQARIASREAAKAREVSRFLASLFEVADPALENPAELTARELLDRGTERIERDLAGQPEVQAEMMSLLGRVDRQLGLFDRAHGLLERALELQRSIHGAEHPAVAATLAELAGVYLDQGQPDEAEARHREALAIRRARLGQDHPDTGDSLRDLAAVMSRLGRYEEAERLQRDALAIHRRHYGAAHQEVASDLNGLGGILRESGQLEPAIATFRESLALYMKLVGPDHLETNTTMNNLAIALFDRGELEEAEALYRRVLDFDLQRLGEEHPNTQTVRNNLAFVLRERGQYAEAERLYRAVLDYDRRKFPAVHPYTATVLYNLGTVLRYREQYAEAEQSFRESLDLFREIYGDEHWRVRAVQGGLAAVHHATGDLVQAERLYRESLTGLEQVLGAHHLQLEPVLIGLGRLLTEGRQHAAAEPLLRRAVTSRLARLGVGDPRTAEAQAWLGVTLAGAGAVDEARTLLAASLEVLLQHPHLARERQVVQQTLATVAPTAAPVRDGEAGWTDDSSIELVVRSMNGPGWRVTDEHVAAGVLVLYVQTGRTAAVDDIARELVARLEESLDEVLVYFHADGANADAFARVQWTPAGGFHTLVLAPLAD